MNYRDRIAHLTEMHKVLNKQIDTAEQSANPDHLNLQELKKKRLALKDEISRLSRLQWEEDHERVNLDDDR
jgi:hypothetical protein